MKVLILFLFFWLGTSFTHGIRDPSGCGNDGNLRITSPGVTLEYKWRADYQGDMFTAVSKAIVNSVHVRKFSWEVRYNGGMEKFAFEWVWTVENRGYYDRVTDESKKDGVFNVSPTTYPNDYYYSTIFGKVNTAVKVDEINITFTTYDEKDNVVRQCSINNIIFEGYCGNVGGDLRITRDDRWAVGYHGDMFTAVCVADYVWGFSWKVEYNGTTEEFNFNWSNKKYKRDNKSSDNDGIFDSNIPTRKSVEGKLYVTTTIYKKRSTTKLDKISLKFTATYRYGNIYQQCSINNIVFKECQTQPPLSVIPPTSKYLSRGQFTCDSGYSLIPMTTNMNMKTKCLNNAEWENQDDFKCYKDCEVELPLKVKLFPSSKYGSFGRFYCDKTYFIHIPMGKNVYTKCMENGEWKNKEDFKCYKKCKVTPPLKVDSTSSTYSSSGNFYCEDGYHLFPIDPDTSTKCTENEKWENKHNFKCYRECKVTPPLKVDSTSSTYSSSGNFYCEDGYQLFPIDPDTSTKCTEDGEWENKHNFKCYRAPNDTRIEGILEIKEDEEMQIYCSFTQTTPNADRVMFSFGGEAIELDVNEPFTRKITIEDDGKELWCQPISEYNKAQPFLEEGKSLTHKLRVLFAPRTIDNNDDEGSECNWTIGDENSCNFTFQSRPLADNISLFVVGEKTGENREVNNGATTIEVEFEFSNSSKGNNQTITINNIETDELDTRKLQLRVSSSLFPQNPIVFDLIVVKETNQQSAIKSSSQLIPIIIGISVGIIFIILLILLVVVKKRQTTNKNTKPADGGVVGGGTNEAIYETADDVAGNSVREERCNVIYAGGNFNTAGNSTREERYNVIYESGGNGAAGNSAKEERCNVIYESGDVGAEERVNPLYGSSSGQGSTKKTNIKNKKAGKYNEKKPSQNMNEDTDQFYATINSNKNMNLSGKRPMQLPQTINDSELYSTVDACKKKNSKSHTSKQDPQNVSELYSTANAAKKKKKNLPSSSTQETHNVSELYASVDVSQNAGKKSKIETQNPSQLYASVKRK